MRDDGGTLAGAAGHFCFDDLAVGASELLCADNTATTIRGRGERLCHSATFLIYARAMAFKDKTASAADGSTGGLGHGEEPVG
jgi:hypothetical protein